MGLAIYNTTHAVDATACITQLTPAMRWFRQCDTVCPAAFASINVLWAPRTCQFCTLPRIIFRACWDTVGDEQLKVFNTFLSFVLFPDLCRSKVEFSLELYGLRFFSTNTRGFDCTDALPWLCTANAAASWQCQKSRNTYSGASTALYSKLDWI
jgi:hypothetical protein